MWYFRPKVAGEPNREPVQGEFFAAEAISAPGMALVREGIQNSLDAVRPGEKVLVRIYLSGQNAAADPTGIAQYFEGAWDHLRATGNGLRPDELPSFGEPCPYLVFEDFGTRGLEGDPAVAFPSRTGQKNHFYHFFRAEGQSDKDASERGIWGVGKHVFLRSSRISGLFGVTVRAQDKRKLLMGKIVVKSHWLGEGHYQDGYFGVPPQVEPSLVMPIGDSSMVEAFCNLFDLQRGNEPGLSLVVPWPDLDIDDRAVTIAVLRGYFYPILSGQLEVIIEAPTVKTVLDRNSLLAEVDRIGEVAGEIKPLIELAHWAGQLPADQKLSLKMTDPLRAWKWSNDLFPSDLLVSLRTAFQKGQRTAISVPVTVRKKDGASQNSSMDVFLVRDDTEHIGHPTFIREGLIVPNVDAPRTRGVRALVTIDDLPLAEFLRDAENPSHTEWQHEGSNFRGKYKTGATDLTFVKRSVYEIVQILRGSENIEDRTVLIDFFSLPPRLQHNQQRRPKTNRELNVGRFNHRPRSGHRVLPPASEPLVCSPVSQ